MALTLIDAVNIVKNATKITATRLAAVLIKK